MQKLICMLSKTQRQRQRKRNEKSLEKISISFDFALPRARLLRVCFVFDHFFFERRVWRGSDIGIVAGDINEQNLVLGVAAAKKIDP